MYLLVAILDGACISMPNGSLVECYDELGTRYAIPVYCLSYPINIVFGGDSVSVEDYSDTDGRDSPADESEPVEQNGKMGKLSTSSASDQTKTCGRHKYNRKAEREDGKEIKIRVRISLTSSSDTRLLVNTAETVLSAKKRLYAQVSYFTTISEVCNLPVSAPNFLRWSRSCSLGIY